MTIVAEDGIKGLTHRAIDRKLALPIGSTSYYYRRQHALVSAVTGHLVALDRADFTECIDILAASPVDHQALLSALAAVMMRMQAPQSHVRARARIELMMAASRDENIRVIFEDLLSEQTAISREIYGMLSRDAPESSVDAYRVFFGGVTFHAAITELRMYRPLSESEILDTLRRIIG